MNISKKQLYFFNVFLLFPTVAYAHGMEAIMMPIGALVGLIICSLIFWHKNISIVFRIILFISSIGAFLLLFILPWEKPQIFWGASGNFLLGIFPPLLITWGTVGIISLFRKPSNK